MLWVLWTLWNWFIKTCLYLCWFRSPPVCLGIAGWNATRWQIRRETADGWIEEDQGCRFQWQDFFALGRYIFFSSCTKWNETAKNDNKNIQVRSIHSPVPGRAACINHSLREQAFGKELRLEEIHRNSVAWCRCLYKRWCIQTLSHQPGHHPWQARVHKVGKSGNSVRSCLIFVC